MFFMNGVFQYWLTGNRLADIGQSTDEALLHF